jgi:hypothetical protein
MDTQTLGAADEYDLPSFSLAAICPAQSQVCICKNMGVNAAITIISSSDPRMIAKFHSWVI